MGKRDKDVGDLFRLTSTSEGVYDQKDRYGDKSTERVVKYVKEPRLKFGSIRKSPF